MADEEAPPVPEAPAETETTDKAEAPTEKLYTRAELDAIVRGKVIEAKRKATGTKPKTKDPTEDQVNVTADVQSLRDEVAQLKAETAFSQALLKVPNAGALNDTQLAALRLMFSPDKPGALADLAADLVGKKPEPVVPETPAPANGTQPPPKPAVPPFVMGAPSPAQREAADDPRSWTASDIAQLRARGEFLPKIEAYKNTLPGSLGLFKRRVPKG